MNNITTSTSTSSNMLTVPSPSSSSPTIGPTRPAFNSQRTQDRLREGEGLYAILFRTDTSNLQRGRKSVFKETGLDDYDSASEAITDVVSTPVASPAPSSLSSASSSQEPPFPSLKTRTAVAAAAQGRPLESWYVWAALFACFGPR